MQVFIFEEFKVLFKEWNTLIFNLLVLVFLPFKISLQTKPNQDICQVNVSLKQQVYLSGICLSKTNKYIC